MIKAMWAASVVFSLVLVYGGIKLIQLTGDSRSPMLGWEQQYVYAVVPISGALIIVYLVYIALCHGFDVLPHRQGGPE
jgi:TRAP-type C4-dicarboxylate transport system permease small subunit